VIPFTAVQCHIWRGLETDEPRRLVCRIDSAVNLARRHKDSIAGDDWRVNISLPDMTTAFKYHNHILRFVVKMLCELLTGRMLSVVEGYLCRPHIGVNDPPIFPLSHLERRS
jgi:hypothetical protein